MRASRMAAALIAAGSLAACKVGPNFKQPNEVMPDRYSGAV